MTPVNNYFIKTDLPVAIQFKTLLTDTQRQLPSYIVELSTDEDGRVVVSCRDPILQGVATDGANEQEAIMNAIEAIDGILASRNLKNGYNITIVHK